MTTPWSHRKRERLDGLPLDAYAPGASVLDVGCYRGLLCYHFANLGARLVHGCDMSVSAIATARHLFEDVDGCESRFEVVDLRKPTALDSFNMHYSIVLLLGVYHKLERELSPDAMTAFMGRLAQRVGPDGHFAWNGFHHHFHPVDVAMQSAGLERVHEIEAIGQYNGIWRRDG